MLVYFSIAHMAIFLMCRALFMYYPVMSKIIRHKWSISLPKNVVSEGCLHINLNLNCSRIKLWGEKCRGNNLPITSSVRKWIRYVVVEINA